VRASMCSPGPTLVGSDLIIRRPHLRVEEEALLWLKVQPVGEPTVTPVGPNPRSVERVKCPASQHRSLPEDWAGALRGTFDVRGVRPEGATRGGPMCPTMARTGGGRRPGTVPAGGRKRVRLPTGE
jgi:hypothetical protein